MQLYVVTTKCRAITDWFVPSYTDIAAALRTVQFPTDPPYTWVGPPRVVRRAIIGSGFDTYVTAILQKPNPPPGGRPTTADQIRSAFGERITRAIQSVDGCFAAIDVAPYFDAQNGADLNWWASGQAAQTRTRDAYPTLTGRLIADENPVGPDSAAVRLPTLGESLPRLPQLPNKGDILFYLALAAGGVALFSFWPEISLGLSARMAARGKRKNPSGEIAGGLVVLAGVGLGAFGAYYLTHRERVQRLVLQPQVVPATREEPALSGPTVVVRPAAPRPTTQTNVTPVPPPPSQPPITMDLIGPLSPSR